MSEPYPRSLIAGHRRVFDRLAADSAADPESVPPSLGLRLAACLLAGLVALYHAENALAEVVEGSVTNQDVAVHWEYDLDQGTGQLIVHNLSVPLDLPDEWLYLVGLVPANVDAQYDPSVVDLNPCTSAVVPPLPYLFAKLPPGTQTTITFQFPTDPREHELVLTDSEYGTGFILSGAGCFVFPKGTLNNFVAVRPIETRPAADLDRDGDVDLEDFTVFAQQFTGPQEP